MTRHIHGPDDEWCEECFGEADAPTETNDNQKAEEWNVVHGWMCAIAFAYELRDADSGARILSSFRNCQKHLPCTRNKRDHRAIEVVVMTVEYYNSLTHVAKKDDEVVLNRKESQEEKQ